MHTMDRLNLSIQNKSFQINGVLELLVVATIFNATIFFTIVLISNTKQKMSRPRSSIISIFVNVNFVLCGILFLENDNSAEIDVGGWYKNAHCALPTRCTMWCMLDNSCLTYGVNDQTGDCRLYDSYLWNETGISVAKGWKYFFKGEGKYIVLIVYSEICFVKIVYLTQNKQRRAPYFYTTCFTFQISTLQFSLLNLKIWMHVFAS